MIASTYPDDLEQPNIRLEYRPAVFKYFTSKKMVSDIKDSTIDIRSRNRKLYGRTAHYIYNTVYILHHLNLVQSAAPKSIPIPTLSLFNDQLNMNNRNFHLNTCLQC